MMVVSYTCIINSWMSIHPSGAFSHENWSCLRETTEETYTAYLFSCCVIHSFIHSGDLYSTSSRDYYSEALPAQSRIKKKDVWSVCQMLPCTHIYMYMRMCMCMFVYMRICLKWGLVLSGCYHNWLSTLCYVTVYNVTFWLATCVRL